MGLSRPDRHRSEIIHEVTRNVERSIKGRTFFLTKKGYIGLGPSDALVNDVVFCLHGGDVPYILRHDTDENVYTLVGETYLHGIMYGELWDAYNNEDHLVPYIENKSFKKIVLI
jgi:hypothetical protein